MLARTNLIGAILAGAYFLTCILIFSLRLLGNPEIGRIFGTIQFLAVIPLLYLLFTAPRLQRSRLYYLQALLMLAFLVVELLLDTIFLVEFRQVRWMVITYVVFFFAATGGLLGIAHLAGKAWITLDGILYLVMAALAFIQRGVTGL